MRNNIVYLISLLILSSCSKDDYDLPKCKFDDAGQELTWLKTIISDREENPTEDMMYCYIEQAELNRKTVFIFMDCNPVINKAIFVIDCEGNPILKDDGRELTVSEVTLKKRKIIWRPVDFACNI